MPCPSCLSYLSGSDLKKGHSKIRFLFLSFPPHWVPFFRLFLFCFPLVFIYETYKMLLALPNYSLHHHRSKPTVSFSGNIMYILDSWNSLLSLSWILRIHPQLNSTRQARLFLSFLLRPFRNSRTWSKLTESWEISRWDTSSSHHFQQYSAQLQLCLQHSTSSTANKSSIIFCPISPKAYNQLKCFN